MRRLRNSFRTTLLTQALGLALLGAPLALVAVTPAQAQIGIGLSINIAPPALPVYEPPPLPGPGYLFTPGYWAYGEEGYYWIPGTWVLPPSPGLLWTPAYWGYGGGIYRFNAGYWGPHVGFYGGINYGFGYGGVGFFGGEWRPGGGFFYNTAAFGERGGIFNNVHNTYVNRTVINNTTINRVSYNGPGGANARPNVQEAAFQRERHVAATPEQIRHFQTAASNPELRAAVNHGAPPVAATARPAEFRGPGVVQAHPAPETAMRPGAAGRPATPGIARPALRQPVTPGVERPALRQPGTSGTERPALRQPGATPHAAMVPHVNRPMAPDMASPGMTRPTAGPRPMAPVGGPRPMAPMGGPRPMGPMGGGGPRPTGGAPHPTGGAPHPMGGAPHPMGGAPHPAAAHPGGGRGPEPH